MSTKIFTRSYVYASDEGEAAKLKLNTFHIEECTQIKSSRSVGWALLTKPDAFCLQNVIFNNFCVSGIGNFDGKYSNRIGMGPLE